MDANLKILVSVLILGTQLASLRCQVVDEWTATHQFSEQDIEVMSYFNTRPQRVVSDTEYALHRASTAPSLM